MPCRPFTAGAADHPRWTGKAGGGLLFQHFRFKQSDIKHSSGFCPAGLDHEGKLCSLLSWRRDSPRRCQRCSGSTERRAGRNLPVMEHPMAVSSPVEGHTPATSRIDWNLYSRSRKKEPLTQYSFEVENQAAVKFVGFGGDSRCELSRFVGFVAGCGAGASR